MKTFQKQARQGDVYLVRVDAVPNGAQDIPREGGRVVLAHGEVTGHAHAIDEKHVQHFRVTDGAERKSEEFRLRAGGAVAKTYLVVSGNPAVLRHEEHTEIEIPPGTYEVRRQREYVRGQIRSVQD